MSFPGIPQDPSQDQQQQPLLGQPVVDPQLLKIKEALAQQMMQAGQDNAPISSPFQLAHKALSPLLGMLMQQKIAKQQMQMQQAAMPEIAAALKSNDPLGALMASKSPLVQQMAIQYMPDWMKQQMATQGKIHERQALDPMDVKKAIDIATGTEPIEVKKTVDIQKATIPLEVQKAIDIAKGTLPIDLAKTRAGQSVGFADLAEKKREFELNQAGGGAGAPAPLGQNPASLYGGH